MARKRKNNFYKDKFKGLKKLDKCLFLLLNLIEVGFLVFFGTMNILPVKYLIALIAVILFISFIFNTIYLSLAKKKKSGTVFRVFYVIYIILLITVGIYYLMTMSVYDSFQGKYKKVTYYVVALKENNYKTIKDIDGLNLGVYSGGTDTVDKALNKLNKKITFEQTDYNDSLEMTEDVINKKVSAMMIEKGYYDVALEENADKKYEDNLKIIYKFSILIKVNDITKEAKVTSEPFAVYISGIDTYGEISSVSRSDVNILAVINPKTKEVLLVSTPRDYYVKLGDTGSYDKLTHAGLYGVETSVKTIENLYNVDINYYFKVNFTSVVDIVNALGGVNVNSEYAFTSYSGYPIKKGINSMDGKVALDFARTRKIFTAGDRVRGMNQLAVINGIIDKALSRSIITKYNSLLQSLKSKFQTNLSTSNIKKLIKMQLSDNADWNINTLSVSGTDANNYTYSYPNQKLYTMVPNESDITKVKSYIKKIYDGKKLGNVSETISTGVISSYSNSSSSSTTNSSSPSSSNSSSNNNNTTDTKKEVIDTADDVDDTTIEDTTTEEDKKTEDSTNNTTTDSITNNTNSNNNN